MREAEAVELFETRARASRRDFTADGAVREICARLDNLPLAIELAAARIKVLSPAALLERLERRLPVLAAGARDAPERQRTLQATIEWSHDLLSPEEQGLFRRLAVFAGGATLDTVEVVCDADLDTLALLVDKSLLRHTDDRFWMLGTIREYASERLDEAGEAAAMRRRHAEHYLALAKEAAPYAREYAKAWLDRLEVEHDNLRAALHELEASGQTEQALRLAGALAGFWGIRGHFVEGRRRLQGALSADERPTAARATALNAAADLATGGEVASARRWAEEALAISRMLDDTWGTAESLLTLGSTHEGDWERARDFWEESARLFREVGDLHHTLLATRLLAWSYTELGDGDRARRLHQENLRQARAAGDEHMEAQSLEALAHRISAEGRPLEAVAMLKEAYRIHRTLEDAYRVAIAVGRFARVLAFTGEARAAATLIACSEARLEEIGASGVPWVAAMRDETLAVVRGALEEAVLAEAAQRGRALTVDEAVELAYEALG